MGHQYDTTEEGSGTGPIAISAFQGTGVKNRNHPDFGLTLRIS